jgi:predicted O-methyltransferase YrrM
MNEVLRSILSNRSVVTEDGITRPLHSNISDEEGKFLQEMIRSARPQVSLEVGCAYGISSLYICEALREVNASKHIIIDPYQHFPLGKGPLSGFEGIGLANLRRAGYSDIIDFHEVPSYQYLSRLTEGRVTIDFAFIDGMHTFDYALVDIFLIDKLLRPGGIVIMDDFSYPSIRKVCRFVLLNLHYRCVGPPSSQAALWRKLARRMRQGGITRLVSAPLHHLVPLASPSDRQLNLPKDVNYVGLQKLEDDLVSNVPEATRCWTDHRPF